MARGFLISDGLHSDIKRTIARVDGMPEGSGPTKIQTRFEALPPPAAEKNTIVVKVAEGFPTLNHEPLAVGQGLAIPLYYGTSTRLVSSIKPEKLSGSSGSRTVASEDDLPAFSSAGGEIRLEASDANSALGARCGVIQSVSDEPVDGYWECTVRVRGLVRCRVLFLQIGAFVSPPPGYPQKAALQGFWRRYLMASTYGHASLIGIAARFPLNGSNTYPFVAEAVVNLG
jgi:hypothetical protein